MPKYEDRDVLDPSYLKILVGSLGYFIYDHLKKSQKVSVINI